MLGNFQRAGTESLKGASAYGIIYIKKINKYYVGGATLSILSLTGHAFIMAPQHSMGTGSILERFADVCVEGTQHVNHGLGGFPHRA